MSFMFCFQKSTVDWHSQLNLLMEPNMRNNDKEPKPKTVEGRRLVRILVGEGRREKEDSLR